jgi:predicted TIM-barrel fold metal-dependent hydrolase
VDDRYTVISADCHAGGNVLDYRGYLQRRYLDEFDAWAATFHNPFEDLRRKDADRNWDSTRRLKELEADGIVAEVIFPNTIPPFFAAGSGLTSPPPTAEEFELRWAGLQAHNRWMADFCSEAPGRRAGMAQILLNDVDAAVAEVRWAKEAGLTGGILTPGVPPDSDLAPLYATDYDPIWAACEELDMPVNHHSGNAGPKPATQYEAAMAVWMIELPWYAHRILWHLMFGGAFERHPGLKLVLTEQSSGWVPAMLTSLDHTFEQYLDPKMQESFFGGPSAKKMSLKPSEYWQRQCFVGASFFRPVECALRDRIGVDKIMWGSDYPHVEGTYPYTTEALRLAFAGVAPSQVQAMLSGNAARLYDFDLDALAPIAAQVGPLVSEVETPLDEVPAEATSPVFTGPPLRPW